MDGHRTEREPRVSRRGVVVGGVKLAGTGALALALAQRGRGWVLAQDATPAMGAKLGYPELQVTVTDQAIQVSPNTVPAGYVLLTVTNNQSAQAGSTGAGLIGPPAGMSLAEFEAQMQATPTAEEQQTGFPQLAYTAVILGGPGNVDPGQTAQAIVNMPEGTWVIGAEGDQPPVQITAIAATPTGQTAPTADLTVTEVEFAFTGLEGGVPAGPQTWQVVNAGAQPHMLVLLQGPDDLTMDQVQEIMNRPENATPPPGGLGEADFRDAGGIFLQSAGITSWTLLDLPAGRYVALCFVPDPRNGEPHAMEGMVAIFDAGGGTPTA